jgi:hypothetical protein
MNNHVFIVDQTTFPIHLEHKFAGIGAPLIKFDSNGNLCSSLSAREEMTTISMLADLARIRVGDQIYFYVQGVQSGVGGQQGYFFGRFMATSLSYVVSNCPDKVNGAPIGKSLPFRIDLDVDCVYPKGVSESDSLDFIADIEHPNQMLWSLIYRKLKGNRGCTMIFPNEEARLRKLIRKHNDSNPIESGNITFRNNEICKTNVLANEPGSQNSLSISDLLIHRYRKNKRFEAHLQWLIISQIGKSSIPSLDALLLRGGKLSWIGNEVSAGVGMRRIDVMLIVEHSEKRELIVVELKSTPPEEQNVVQLHSYLAWVRQYFPMNRNDVIRPVLLSLPSRRKGNKRLKVESKWFEKFENLDDDVIGPLRIQLEIDESDEFSFVLAGSCR